MLYVMLCFIKVIWSLVKSDNRSCLIFVVICFVFDRFFWEIGMVRLLLKMLSWNHLGLAYCVSISSTIRGQIIQLVFACALRFTLRWVSKNVSKFTLRYFFFHSEIGSIQTCIQSVISVARSLFCCYCRCCLWWWWCFTYDELVTRAGSRKFRKGLKFPD